MVKKIGLILKKLKEFKHKEIIVFSLIILVIYLSTMSCSLDDEDSIHFIRGMKDFDVSKHQPHPPGFPVYIFFGKIFYFLFKNELLALTILSSFAGFLSLLVFYFLIFEMFDKKIALMSTMVLGVTPLFWLNSLKAMSDMTGLFFILLSMYFIYYFIKYKEIKHLYVGSFISAIAVGVRFHALFVVVPLLVYAYFKIDRREQKKSFRKKFFYSVLIFFIGILFWLLPMLYYSGFENYLNKASSLFLSRYDRVPSEGNFLKFISWRVQNIFGLFLISYGISSFNPGIIHLILLVMYLFFIFSSYWIISDKRNMFFIIPLLFYSLMLFLVLFSNNPRYLLIFIPFISLLLIFGVLWFEKHSLIIFILLFFSISLVSFPLVMSIHNLPSPMIESIDYLATNYNLANISVYAEGTLSEYLHYYNIRASLNHEGNKRIFYISPHEYELKNNNNSLNLIKKFERSSLIETKHNIIYLYEITNSSILSNLNYSYPYIID
jgi:hypothetical protein